MTGPRKVRVVKPQGFRLVPHHRTIFEKAVEPDRPILSDTPTRAGPINREYVWMLERLAPSAEEAQEIDQEIADQWIGAFNLALAARNADTLGSDPISWRA